MNEAISALRMPKKTYFGIGAVEKVREAVKYLKVSNALIITDRGVINAGLVDTLIKELSSTTMKTSIFDEVEPEPTVESIEKATRSLEKTEGIDLLIAVGGGSERDRHIQHL